MSTNVGSVHYDLDLKTNGFDRAVAGLSGKLNAIGSKMTDVGKTMTIGVTLPVLAGFGLAVKAASDLNETMNKVDVAFKDQAANVKKWGETSLKSMGLAKGSALDAAALFGDMSTAMGLNTKQAYKMSTSLTQLGADLASFKNISFAEAQTALAGVFTGETESLKRLGIVMTEANLAQFALSRGIKENIQDMTQAEKVQLRYAYVMSVTKNAQGDFSRTFSGTANQMRFTQERVKQLSAEFGQRLLPITGKLLETLNGLLNRFQALTPAQQDLIIKVGLFAAALGPLLFILGNFVKLVSTLMTIFTVSNPVLLAVAAALAIIGAIVFVVYKNWDKLRGPIMSAVNALYQGYLVIATFLKPVLQFLVTILGQQLKKAWEDIKRAIDITKAALAPFAPQLQTLGKYIMIAAVVPLGVLVAALVLVIGIIAGVIAAIARIIGWFSRFQAAGLHAVSSFVNAFRNMINYIRNYSGGFGSLLYNAGRSLIQGFVNGLRSMINKPKETIQAGLSGLRKLFPFSPAKEGPFSGKGYTTFSGMAIMKDFAKGIKKNAVLPQRAIQSALAGSAQAAQLNVDARQQLVGQTPTNIYGNITIGSQQDTDYFFQRLNRSQDLLGLGLAPMGEL